MRPIIKETSVKSIITKSNLPVCDYSVNPYIGCPHGCKYCYASFMKRFTKHAEPWGEFLDVKYWKETKNPGQYAGKELFIGSVTDPYNPQEEKYERTKALLTQLKGSGAKLSIATKSDLILRDLDLIKSFHDARVSWSINTLDNEFQKDMDNAVSIERRLQAMKIFHDAGVRTTCFISPIFPQITDVKAIITRVQSQCNLIWLENLNLRGNYKSVIMDYVKRVYPAFYPLYYEIYNQNNKCYWEELNDEIKAFAKIKGLEYVVNNDRLIRPFAALPTIVNYFYHEQIKKKKIGIHENVCNNKVS